MINLTAITRIMSKHLLDDLHVGAGRNREGCGGMPKHVRCQAGNACAAGSVLPSSDISTAIGQVAPCFR